MNVRFSRRTLARSFGARAARVSARMASVGAGRACIGAGMARVGAGMARIGAGMARIGARMAGVAAPLLAAATIAGTAVSPAAAAELKIATVAPDGSHWMREMRAAAAEIRERTDGGVEIKFYPGGVMGNDAQVLRKVRVGQLQGGAFTAGGLAERYNGLNLYGLPLLFRSLDEVDHVREALDGVLREGLEQAGFVSFGFIEGGFAQLLANHPVRGIEDMRRRKVWVPEGDAISFFAMESIGLSPVVLPVTDVLTGLQTGLLDIVAASPVAALVMQWHTKVRYMTEVPVSYSMGLLAIDQRAFQRLDEEHRAIMTEVLTRTVRALDEAARNDNREAREVLLRAGIQTVDVNAADVEALRAEIEALYPQLRARPDIDAALFDRLIGLLESFRADGRTAGVEPER